MTPAERTRKWREKNPKAVSDWKKANRKKHLEHVRKYNSTRDKDKQRAYNRLWHRKKMGLPTPTRDCPATCELCGMPPNKRALALDHCHITGAFRGWLCNRCNIGLGLLGDTIESVRNALDYLEKRNGYDTT